MKTSAFRKYFRYISKVFRKVVFLSGLISLLMLLIALTELPFWGRYHLGQYKNIAEESRLKEEKQAIQKEVGDSISEAVIQPDYIVMMGSSGMPGKNALLTAYYMAYWAETYPESCVIIALPDDTTQQGHLYQLEKELRLRGVKNKIQYESQGINTYWQVHNIAQMIDKEASVLIVNLPELIYRSAKCFEQHHFKKIYTWAVYENNLNEDLLYKKSSNSLNTMIEEQHQLRYQVWNHLKYELNLLREYMAITYYYLNNWI